MPKRTDIKSICIIGAGPIIIGQACEFDYSGVQACKALRQEGYRVILVNSNPATIMTDPEIADATYIEPITPAMVTKILEHEKPDALLPTMGGQTALNTAMALTKDGTLDRLGIELIGANRAAIEKAEDRFLFREAMGKIGLSCPKSMVVQSLQKAQEALEAVGLPAIIRPSFTLGGTGGGIAYNRDQYNEIVASGIAASPVGEVLVEESVLGWKEYEMEVVRDRKDNCIIICSIENIDPMGIHTGDSITVAPALTLTDKEYQVMRNASLAVLREIGVDTGGSNVQFAINPADGKMIVIEMNPRVSRSSALASKATGFPIAKIAAKLAVGYTLDELKNDITGDTPASFEPTIDYVVTKIPRFAFEKFPGTEATLTTAMKSVGEVMAIGRNFQESMQKALRGLEIGLNGFNEMRSMKDADRNTLMAALAKPTPDRLLVVADALRHGITVQEINAICKYDPWFLEQIASIVTTEKDIATNGLPKEARELHALKRMGFSDARLAQLMSKKESDVSALRHKLGVVPVFKRIDTCAAEFTSGTPYLYSTYESNYFTPPPEKKISATDLVIRKAKATIEEADTIRNVRKEAILAKTTSHYSSPDVESWANDWNDRDVVGILQDKNKVTLIAEHKNKIVGFSIYHIKENELGALYVTKGLNGAGTTLLSATEKHAHENGVKFLACSSSLNAEEFYLCNGYQSLERSLHTMPNGRQMPCVKMKKSHLGKAQGITSCESRPTNKTKIIILGGGPNRIGQGIEFDYCCVHAVMALRDRGFETIMVNCNPETVSTDYDTSDRLYFEPLTAEDVIEIVHKEQTNGTLLGVIVQFGGQTPLKLAHALQEAKIPILGTSPDAIDLAEDRERFQVLLKKLDLKQPANGFARNVDEAEKIAAVVSYPVVIRPSYVLGGRAMEIVHDVEGLRRYMEKAVFVSGKNPVLIDYYLQDAIEVDVDVVADKDTVFVAGIMEHIEEAGIHSGDSSCSLPPHSLSPTIIQEIERQAEVLAREIHVIGLMNVQFAVKDGVVYILEVNPRASRTVPFVAKATGIPIAKIAARIMAGEKLASMKLTKQTTKHLSVKTPVFPFARFTGVDVVLGPEMKSTGEVMGIDRTFARAYAKAQMGAGIHLPTHGTCFISVKDRDKTAIITLARQLVNLGFNLIATSGTAVVLQKAGVKVTRINKVFEGQPHIIDAMINGDVHMMINTTAEGAQTLADSFSLRRTALMRGIPQYTTLAGARAAIEAISALQTGSLEVGSLQEYLKVS